MLLLFEESKRPVESRLVLGGPSPHPSSSKLLFAFVFSPRGDPAPDVPFRLVLLQHCLYLLIQGPVEGGQAFRQVLMYGYC